MLTNIAAIEHLTEQIIGCAIEVHKTLGAGLLESVYRECLMIEMQNAQLRFESERYINLTDKGVPIRNKLRLDLLVEGAIVEPARSPRFVYAKEERVFLLISYSPVMNSHGT